MTEVQSESSKITESVTGTAPVLQGSDLAKKRAKAYNAAESRLRRAHRDEFQRLLKDETEKLGLEYKPQLTAEERALIQIEELIEKHPSVVSDVITLLAHQPEA